MSELKTLDELSLNSQLKTEVENISRQIIELVNPVAIYLFGSSVKNEMNSNSDLDWMIVLEDSSMNKRGISQTLYRNVKRDQFPCDFIVTNSDQLEKHKNNIGLIYHYILKEGKCIYAR